MNKTFVLGWGLITAAFFGGATFAWAAESIGGAEIVVNKVKGNLTAGKVVSVLRGDDVYREEGVKTSADSTVREQVEIKRREQRLGGHEPIGDGGNVAYVLNWFGLRRFRHDLVTSPTGRCGR